MDEKNVDLTVLTQLLMDALSPRELSRLMYDFSERGLGDIRGVFDVESHGDRAFELVQFAARRGLIPDLLKELKERNPYQYHKYEESLLVEPEIRDSISIKSVGDSVSQTISGDINVVIGNVSGDIFIHQRSPLNNPYIVGNPIQPDNVKVFLGRYDVAEAIIQEVKNPGQKPSILLYGRRRMGKTSALLNISHLLRDPSIITVYVSAQSVRYHTNIDFCFYLAQDICEKVRSAGVLFNQADFDNKQDFVSNPILTLSDFFHKLNSVLAEAQKTCLISIDEYEEIDNHIDTKQQFGQGKSISRELLLELRDTLQHKSQFVFLFAGIHFLNDLSKVNWSEIFINVKTIHISFLDRKEGRKLLTKPVPKMTYENEEIISKILDATGCQPLLLQAIASEIVNILNSLDTYTVTDSIFNDALEAILKNYNTYFDYIWDIDCQDSQHQDLLKLVASHPNGINYSSLSSYRIELRDLVRKEILVKDGDIIKLTMPIIGYWLRKNQYIL